MLSNFYVVIFLKHGHIHRLNYVLINLDTDDSMVVVGDRRVHLLRDTDRDVEDETGVEGGDTDLRQYRRARVVHASGGARLVL